MREIVKRATHIAITDYLPNRIRSLESKFSYRKNNEQIVIGMIYDKDSNELRIFGGANLNIIKYTSNFLPVRLDYGYDTIKPISTRLRVMPRDKLQEYMIQFLIGAGQYEMNYNFTQLSCNAETDSGKTFAAIAMISYVRVKTAIIVNRINIKDNWIKEIKKFTDMDMKRVCELDTKTLNDILDDKFDTDIYHIFVVVHRTVQNFAKERGWSSLGIVFNKIGIGLKIFDEAHREFANTTYIECYTNTAKTLYLTATRKLSDPQANYIYQRLFVDMPKFDQASLGYTDHKKHITMLAVFYNSNPSLTQIKVCKTKAGFSAVKHSLYQIESDNHFFGMISTLVEKFSIGKGFRTLILVSRIVACEEVKDFIASQFPDTTVGVYHSKVSDEEKDRVFYNDHIIVSTNRSLGEAVTIPKLQFVLNCEAHNNYGDQASGRLRKFDENEKYIYAELIDEGFPSIKLQWKNRKKLYETKFGKIISVH